MDLQSLLFRIAVKLLTSTFLTFAAVFILVSVVGLLIQLIPCLIRGRIDIDPLSILLISVSVALLASGLRIALMRTFSRIKI